MSPSKELAVIDLTDKRLVGSREDGLPHRIGEMVPTGRYFAVLFRENVTKQLWKGPLDLFAGLVGHPRSYYTLRVMIYTLDGKVACKRIIMEKLLTGGGYIDWGYF